MMKKRLVLIELNEINFDIARKYAKSLRLPNFEKLFASGVRRTSSESSYEQLEPWIQWVSAHSGQTAAEHGVFRLGDVVGTKVPQMFELLESKGLRIGAVSPMNAENRLANPAYFLPDPWTLTPSDGSFWSRLLSKAISQAVNDNSESHITWRSALSLIAGLMRFAQFKHYRHYLRLALKARGAPWRKALFLDLFLNDLHVNLLSSKRPDFSTLFLNAGAHIQHHYFLGSSVVELQGRRNPEWYLAPNEDPMAEMMETYDLILGDYLQHPGTNVIVATGLTQQPYPRVTFYYRLRNHSDFLNQLGIRHGGVSPRMTRDFLVDFDSPQDALDAARTLAALTASTDGLPLFEEVDNRGQSLFVTLTYPNEIGTDIIVKGGRAPLRLHDHVVFVAIKNGMHAPHGYISCQGEVSAYAPPEGAHVKHIHSTILRFFTEQGL